MSVWQRFFDWMIERLQDWKDYKVDWLIVWKLKDYKVEKIERFKDYKN